MSQSDVKHKRSVAFELFRAIAVSMVVLGHFSAAAVDLPVVVKKICFSIASYGVPLFFMISGFLLAASFVSIFKGKQQRFGASIKIFMFRRLLRIYPAYLVSLILLSTIQGVEWLDITLHIFNVHNLSDQYATSINPVYWTLAVEFQWYLVAPFFILFFVTHRVRVTLVIVLVLWLLSLGVRLCLVDIYIGSRLNLSQLSWLGQSQLYIHLYNFLMGVVIYQLKERRIKKNYAVISLLLISLLSIGYIESDLTALLIGHYQIDVNIRLLLSCISTVILAVLVLISLNVTINRWVFKLVSFISLISYSLYIYHAPVINYLEAYLLPWYSRLFIYLAVSIFMSVVSYVLVEAPFLRLSKKMTRIG
ncbi:MAG: acyltransferase [Methylococcales bacterium]|nr:acyltransferase [Methylococcales bacterium]